MKNILIFSTLILLFTSVSAMSKEIPYSVADKIWNADSGNHRVEIQVTDGNDAIRVFLPWRRRDSNPEQKRIIITDANGKEVKNILRLNINREFGEFIFQPVSGAGTYYIYYMPFLGKRNMGWFDGDYLKPENAPDQLWIKKNQLEADLDSRKSKLPEAKIIQIQSRTAFDSFYPMEICATASETKQMIEDNQKEYLLFPEDRSFPIRMTRDLPQRWVLHQPSGQFQGTAERNEYYTFQIGVFAARKKLQNLKVSYSDYQDRITCFNLGGIDFMGKPFTKRVDVEKGEIQALWFGVDIPEETPAGDYSVLVTIQPENDQPQTIRVNIRVEDKVLADRGDSQLWRHSRLRWLNSTLGIDDQVVPPYKPLAVKDKTISYFLHSISLDSKGLPETIESKGCQILSKPLQFIVETDQGNEKFQAKNFRYVKQNEGVVDWNAEAVNENLALSIEGTMEFDGNINYSIKVKALKNLSVKDIRLELPIKKEIAQYFMGMGLNGRKCPETYSWKWQGPQDSYWIGTVNAGVHCELRGASYSGPMLNLYHPKAPPAWSNENKGGFTIRSTSREVTSTNYTGEYQLSPNEELKFEFALLITPVKEINTADQFTNRYYHNGSLPAPRMEDLKSGIKITNVHHASPVNPYINYPFIAVDTMKNFVDKWHKNGLKVKIYYTVRELSNQTTEIWALRSLGNEILGNGRGGGYIWLREHFADNYQVQWFNQIKGWEACDAAVLTSGESRWYNYYIEGLNWLVKNVNIDGLYLDDVAYDRLMLKRMRKVMDAAKPGCLLDLHSNTEFSIGPANQYTEFFPYINKLWFGEGFKYEEMSPENWLVESSGIPFGLMGDMLQGGGNRWRGMIYGMTVRYPWSSEGQTSDPRHIWKIWDSFGIADAKMMGYWEEGCPVKTNDPEVLATAYVKKGKTLIAIASWASSKKDFRLLIDWKALGLNPAKVTISAPAIPGFQEAKSFRAIDQIPVEPKKGWLFVLQ